MKSQYTLTQKHDLARHMRNNMTQAEECLWGMIQLKQIGYRFQPQVVLQGYIVDFYCPALRLVVEVDGSIHELPEVRVVDEIREIALSRAAILMLRFDNEDVLVDRDGVVKKIREACIAREKSLKAVDLITLTYSERKARSRRWKENYDPKPFKAAPLGAREPVEKLCLTSGEVKKLKTTLLRVSWQKNFPLNPAAGPIASKVNSQRWALQEWLRKKA